jgi:hypothetical protein
MTERGVNIYALLAGDEVIEHCKGPVLGQKQTLGSV